MRFGSVKKHTVWLCGLSLFSLCLSACSEDRCPPPDDNSAAVAQKLQSASAACLARSDEFHVCALAALEGFDLSESERAGLSSCSYPTAVADTTAADVFNDARSAVTLRCVSF